MRRGESGISCLVGIDKPVGPSSHDVVSTVRRALGERRVGHAGTLDPLASGVLVVGVGQATRLMGMLTLDDKEYVASVRLGIETTTDDAEGGVASRGDVPPEYADEECARHHVSGLVGSFEQVPPAFSAISVGGTRSYARARAGEAVELAPRPVVIYEAELLNVDASEGIIWTVRLRVSKGTYVRSVARDLGRSLGCGAHLSGLRRTASGCIDVEACIALAELCDVGPALALARCIDPARATGMPLRWVSDGELADVRCGRRIELGTIQDVHGAKQQLGEGQRACLVGNQRLYGVWERRAGMLSSVATFPEGVVGVRV